MDRGLARSPSGRPSPAVAPQLAPQDLGASRGVTLQLVACACAYACGSLDDAHQPAWSYGTTPALQHPASDSPRRTIRACHTKWTKHSNWRLLISWHTSLIRREARALPRRATAHGRQQAADPLGNWSLHIQEPSANVHVASAPKMEDWGSAHGNRAGVRRLPFRASSVRQSHRRYRLRARMICLVHLGCKIR